jgi:hypothetical protein
LAEKIGLRRAVKTAQIPDPNIIAAEILEDLQAALARSPKS